MGKVWSHIRFQMNMQYMWIFSDQGFSLVLLMYQNLKYDNSNVAQIFSVLNEKAEMGKNGWQQATYRWPMTGIPVVVHAPQF